MSIRRTTDQRNRLRSLCLVLPALIVLFLPAAAEPPSRPNFLVILTDDQAGDTYVEMPALQQLLIDEGLRVENFFVTTPLCCPSRASILLGRYAHNHLVAENTYANGVGGFGRYYELGHDRNDLARWLQEAGYDTALIGKYLNGHAVLRDDFPGVSNDYVPPYWTHFQATLGGRYVDFPVLTGSTGAAPGEGTRTRPPGFRTDVEAQLAEDFVRARESAERPWFLWLPTFAPHFESSDAPDVIWAERHAAAFAGRTIPRDPTFDWIAPSRPLQLQALPALSDEERELFDQQYRDRLRSLLAVDDLVARLVGALAETGQLERTFIFYFSDNGFLLGHHRLTGKLVPYDRSARSPLIARGPGIPAGGVTRSVAANIDLAPTLLELAGARPFRRVDGVSLVPLLWRGERVRDHVLIENYRSAVVRGIALELGYAAVRTETDLYVEWESGDREYFDLRDNPFPVDNRHDELSSREQRRWSRIVAWLAGCSGRACRAGRPRGWPDHFERLNGATGRRDGDPGPAVRD